MYFMRNIKQNNIILFTPPNHEPFLSVIHFIYTCYNVIIFALNSRLTLKGIKKTKRR